MLAVMDVKRAARILAIERVNCLGHRTRKGAGIALRNGDTPKKAESLESGSGVRLGCGAGGGTGRATGAAPRGYPC